MTINKQVHLYNRFGFGLKGSEIRKFEKISFEKKLNKETVEDLELDLSYFKGMNFDKLSQKKRREIQKIVRQKIAELNINWLLQMIESDNIIQEKMNLFWHHHFACIIKNPYMALKFTNIIRNNATGNFKTMLTEIAKSSAMIEFLHTKQNKKTHPNEDFARELCELFTLGRDNEYSEKDVQEIARAFTGWKHRFTGEFFVHPKQHDNSEKTIFGQTGNFGGEDVIDLLLQKRACAKFICKNIYEYFVNPNINEKNLDEITDVFYESNYNIKTLIIHIAEADWFYDEENIMVKIKSPIEFIVGLSKQFDIKNENSKSWLILQRVFSQVLYHPPNVKGWKVNQEWIDSNSLPLRLRLPSIILTNAKLDIETKPDYDANPNDGEIQNKISKKLGFSFNWDFFFKSNKDTDFMELFFNNKVSEQATSFISQRDFDSEKEKVIQLISLPEYQLV